MPKQVVSTAVLKCSQGLSPSSLVVLPVDRTFVEKKPAATIMDHVPMVNILPFGLCNSSANPAVIAATAAASGVHTPAPCIPVVPAPWTPGGVTVTIGKKIALDDRSKCFCTWAGTISVTSPAQTSDNIP